MEIRNVKNKALKAFIESESTKGLPPAHINEIRDIVTFLLEAETVEEVFDLPKYKPHRLKGSRAGTISLSVTANGRITFAHDTNDIIDLDFEDYH